MNGKQQLLVLAFFALAGDSAREVSAATTPPLDPMVWTPDGCDPDATGRPTVACPPFFPTGTDRVVLVAVKMVDESTRLSFVRVFGVDDNDDIHYVLDVDDDLFNALAGAYLGDLQLGARDGGRGGGLMGDGGPPPIGDGPKGSDPPTPDIVKRVGRAARVHFAALDALARQ